MLPESPALRTLPRLRVVRAQQVHQVGSLQTGGAIGPSFFVNQQWELDPGLFAKLLSVLCVAQADDGQLRASAVELSLMLAQLRDVLAAKDSTIVAKENDYGQVRFPQSAKPFPDAIGIGQRNARK